MRRILALLTLACLLPPLPALAATGLPDKLEMVYTLKYGSLAAGNSTRSLERQSDGSYRYTIHTLPTGIARTFTRVEWFEEGTFRVVKNQVRPLSYLKYRKGSSKDHRHSTTVNWDQGQILYSSGATVSLPQHYQDQGSLVFDDTECAFLEPFHTGNRACHTGRYSVYGIAITAITLAFETARAIAGGQVAVFQGVDQL